MPIGLKENWTGFLLQNVCLLDDNIEGKRVNRKYKELKLEVQDMEK